jgi:hypothetical protein
MFPYGWPAIATGAVVGILMNLITVLWKPPVVREEADLVDLAPAD